MVINCILLFLQFLELLLAKITKFVQALVVVPGLAVLHILCYCGLLVVWIIALASECVVCCCDTVCGVRDNYYYRRNENQNESQNESQNAICKFCYNLYLFNNCHTLTLLFGTFKSELIMCHHTYFVTHEMVSLVINTCCCIFRRCQNNITEVPLGMPLEMPLEIVVVAVTLQPTVINTVLPEEPPRYIHLSANHRTFDGDELPEYTLPHFELSSYVSAC